MHFSLAPAFHTLVLCFCLLSFFCFEDRGNYKIRFLIPIGALRCLLEYVHTFTCIFGYLWCSKERHDLTFSWDSWTHCPKALDVWTSPIVKHGIWLPCAGRYILVPLHIAEKLLASAAFFLPYFLWTLFHFILYVHAQRRVQRQIFCCVFGQKILSTKNSP